LEVYSGGITLDGSAAFFASVVVVVVVLLSFSLFITVGTRLLDSGDASTIIIVMGYDGGDAGTALEDDSATCFSSVVS